MTNPIHHSNKSSIGILSTDVLRDDVYPFLDFHDLSIVARTSNTAEMSILARQELKSNGQPEWEQKKARWIQGDPAYVDFFNRIIGRVKMNRLPVLAGRRDLTSITLEDFPTDQPIIKFNKKDGSPCLAFYLLHQLSVHDETLHNIDTIEFIHRMHATSDLWAGYGFQFFQLVHYCLSPLLINPERDTVTENYLLRLLKNEPCGITRSSEGNIIELDPKITSTGESVVQLINPPGKQRDLLIEP